VFLAEIRATAIIIKPVRVSGSSILKNFRYVSPIMFSLLNTSVSLLGNTTHPDMGSKDCMFSYRDIFKKLQATRWRIFSSLRVSLGLEMRRKAAISPDGVPFEVSETSKSCLHKEKSGVLKPFIS
jgi:hypothetical protein